MTDATAVAVHQTAPGAIIELVRLAVDKGLGVEALERLQVLHERVSDRQAALDFAEAFSRFQASCPPIPKSSAASITTKSGLKYGYKYAELDQIARTTRPHLEANGLSYLWDSVVEKNVLTCRCTLRHLNGHRETSSFSAPVDSAAGMSEQQKFAAALTYARRQSLVQVLGLTTTDDDNDAAADQVTRITEDQALYLNDLLTELDLDRAKFLAWAEVESVAQIAAANFTACERAIRATAEQRSARQRGKPAESA